MYFPDTLESVCNELSLNYTLKEEQKRIIRLIVEEKNVFGLLPTGFGKSDCFALLPLVLDKVHYAQKHISLVISPLMSLMMDLTRGYEALGVLCVAILTQEEMTPEQIKGLEDGQYSLVFSSPEAISVSRWRSIIQSWGKRVGCITIDEAHCLTTWGKDFRSSYQKVVEISSLCVCPVLFLTATATQPMIKEILESLNFDRSEVELIAVLPDRPNIRLEMRRAKEQGDITANLKFVADDIIEKGNAAEKTIIYARTIDQVTQVFGSLIKVLGSHAWVDSTIGSTKSRIEMYHGSTDAAKQKSIINRITSGTELKVVVATVAFGMGVDVRDISVIVHWAPSKTILDYWQEIGRCARDGRQGTAHLIITPMSLHPKKIDEKMLSILKTLLKEKTCIRKAILTELFVDGMSKTQLDTCSTLNTRCCNHCL